MAKILRRSTVAALGGLMILSAVAYTASGRAEPQGTPSKVIPLTGGKRLSLLSRDQKKTRLLIDTVNVGAVTPAHLKKKNWSIAANDASAGPLAGMICNQAKDDGDGVHVTLKFILKGIVIADDRHRFASGLITVNFTGGPVPVPVDTPIVDDTGVDPCDDTPTPD